MKISSIIFGMPLLVLMFVSCKKEATPEPEPSPIYGEALDVENNTYVTVDIKGAMWFTENLACKKFRNGDTLFQAKTNDEWEMALIDGVPAWCYPNNDSILAESYGIMYNYHAITDSRGLAPEGWHISSAYDWQRLIDLYGGEWNAGYFLKATEGWQDNGNGSNSTKFNALPCGKRISIGSFFIFGDQGWWWTSTPIETSSSGNYSVLLPSINYLVNICTDYDWGNGMYVRCVKY